MVFVLSVKIQTNLKVRTFMTNEQGRIMIPNKNSKMFKVFDQLMRSRF